MNWRADQTEATVKSAIRLLGKEVSQLFSPPSCSSSSYPTRINWIANETDNPVDMQYFCSNKEFNVEMWKLRQLWRFASFCFLESCVVFLKVRTIRPGFCGEWNGWTDQILGRPRIWSVQLVETGSNHHTTTSSLNFTKSCTYLSTMPLLTIYEGVRGFSNTIDGNFLTCILTFASKWHKSMECVSSADTNACNL